MPEAGNRINDFYLAVGKAIKDARQDSGLSQAALAQRIGFTRSSVANLEAGRQRIQLHLFVLIARTLSVELAKLLPDTAILDIPDIMAQDVLREHLAGTPETTQEFVLGAVAQVTPGAMRKES